LALYGESTGEAAFAEYLGPLVQDGVLDLACNGELDYRLSGVRVHQHAEWGQREAEGGGDVVGTTVRGTGAVVTVTQGPETGHRAEIHLGPGEAGDLEARLGGALDSWRDDFPGLELGPSKRGFQVLIPKALRIAHEAQFAPVLDAFLDSVEAGEWPAAMASRIRTRYTLLARAHELALAE
jgi:hypothetical protein